MYSDCYSEPPGHDKSSALAHVGHSPEAVKKKKAALEIALL